MTKKHSIQSMTGYGESSYESNDVYLHVSIKSVNGKVLDIDAHLPRAFAAQEIMWRKYFAQKLTRGRILLSLNCQLRSLAAEEILNKDLLKHYAHFLKEICTSLDIQQDVLNSSLRLPGIIRSETMYNVSEEIQAIAKKTVLQALDRCLESRIQEGENLVQQLKKYLQQLHDHCAQLDQQVEKQQTNLRKRLQERLTNQSLTPQEWEQELTSSLSKASIEEEKVRFKSHLKFFENTLAQNHIVGKKLAFIIQELGRELNTMGSKAQYGPLQHLAIDMKEVVEQMREQVANLA
ncbi:MAG: DUF1732 domain-containing protein [Bacteroidota bacterium]